MNYHDYRIIGETDTHIREKCSRTGREITIRKSDINGLRKNKRWVREYMSDHKRDLLQPGHPDFRSEYGEPKK